MTVPDIHSEPCQCPKGQCDHFVDNDADCINRLPNASVMACKTCLSMTWHSSGACQRCLWLSTLPPAQRADTDN